MSTAHRFGYTDAEVAELINLYHLARTALAYHPIAERTSYHRRVWAADAFHRAHPERSETSAYKILDDEIRWRDGGYASKGRRRKR